MDPLFLSLAPGIMRRGGSKPRGRESKSAAQRSAAQAVKRNRPTRAQVGSPSSLFPKEDERERVEGKAFHHRATPSRQSPGSGRTCSLHTRSLTYLPTLTCFPYLTYLSYLPYSIPYSSHTYSFLSRNNPCSLQVQQSWLQLLPPSVILSSLVHPFYSSTLLLHLTLPSMPNKSRLISSPLFLLTTSVSPFACI